MPDDLKVDKAVREDLIGRWSVEKLNLLKKYLSAYVKILSNQAWCKGYEYIDAFAGTGKPKTKDEQVYIDGSPRIALSLSPPFTQYHFIEQSDWRVSRLLALRKEFHALGIAIYHGDCNKVLHEQILPQLTRATQKRAIVFVDPFGMHIEWQTMVALAQPKTIEVFVNVPIMAVQRSVLKRQPEKITPQDRDRMRRFWGSGDWEAAFYQEEATLFGTEQIKVRAAASELARRYGDRLATLFPYHTQPIVMTNSTNSPLYALVFASHNKTGVKIAQDIFAKYLVRK